MCGRSASVLFAPRVHGGRAATRPRTGPHASAAPWTGSGITPLSDTARCCGVAGTCAGFAPSLVTVKSLALPGLRHAKPVLRTVSWPTGCGALARQARVSQSVSGARKLKGSARGHHQELDARTHVRSAAQVDAVVRVPVRHGERPCGRRLAVPRWNFTHSGGPPI